MIVLIFTPHSHILSYSHTHAYDPMTPGLVGTNITIHSYIEPGRLRHPYGDPETIYPAVHAALGLKPYQGWDTDNAGVTVALFVHALEEWVLSRSHYASLLELLLVNTREPLLHVPALRALPPPPAFDAITPGPQCLALPACVSVPVYFQRAVVRCVEDVFPTATGTCNGRMCACVCDCDFVQTVELRLRRWGHCCVHAQIFLHLPSSHM
jgi:hypothetical protein